MLATIETTLINFLKLNPNSDDCLIDLMGSGDAYQEQVEDTVGERLTEDTTARDGIAVREGQTSAAADEEEDWDFDSSPDKNRLMNVLKTFTMVKEEFNKKFKKIWA